MIVKHTLPNGMRVVAEQIPHVRSVAMGLWVHTGSKNETARSNGISHFLEHMMFKGTEKRSARELAEEFDAIGGQVNAFTSKEITCYYAKVLDEHFSQSLEILSDMFYHSTFHEEEIEKEKKVVIEEIRMVEDTPDDLVHDLLAEVSYQQQALAFPVIGTTENVQQFSREDLVQYRNHFYHPRNIVIALAGNIPNNFINQIQDRFANKFPKNEMKKQSQPIFTPRMELRQKNTEQSHLCLGLPGVPIEDPRIYQAILLNTILGGNMSSRLFQRIREEKGLAYSVFSYHSSYQQTGLFTIYAGTAQGQEDQVIRDIRDVLDELQQQGLKKEELQKAKEQLKANLMLGLESTNNRMSRLGRNELLLEKHVGLDELIEIIEAISLKEVNQLSKECFDSPMSLAMVSPSDQIPSSMREVNS